MQLSFAFHQNIIWVIQICFALFSILFSASSSSRRPEMSLICDFARAMPSDTVSNSFIPHFVDAMESVLKQVSRQHWGCADVTSSPPSVYALAQCRGDLSDLECKLCFNQGRVKLPSCLPASSGRIFLDGCFLRYDDYNFFKESVNPTSDSVNCSRPAWDLRNDSYFDVEFKDNVAQVIDNVTDMAIKNGYYGAVEQRGGPSPVYAVCQCLQILEEKDCRNCLVTAGSQLKDCPPGEEGTALFTGCYIRYSTQRLFNSTTPPSAPRPGHEVKHHTITVVAISVFALSLLTAFGAYIGYRRLSRRKGGQNNLVCLSNRPDLNWEYEVLEKATDSFNESRKLGQGGAGSVYKGILPDGRTVAVKKLAYTTRQWADQFFNEVNLISGIKNNNLVRLLGCSIEGPESLLVYEYVPNRSLDKIIFVRSTINILNWQQRFDIILGTAKGLAYLHGGSGVKIIHRDIKTSNILLDENFTPKIADFGLVRCAAADKSHISTGIAGTLGYMAPEYLVRGQLTEKADVYGFGVVVLEVASGKKNSLFSPSSSILHTVWKHYKAETITSSIDSGLYGRFSEKEAARVLQIGLLCTQASPTLRPSMEEIVQMLTDSECEIPSPKQPPFLNASVLSPEDECTASSITRADEAVPVPCNDTQQPSNTEYYTLDHSFSAEQYLTSYSIALLRDPHVQGRAMTSSFDDSPSSPPLDWKFSQVFGESVPGEDLQDVDVVSAIGFDKTGDYLAAGDRGGRVVIFERKDGKDTYLSRKELEQLDFTIASHPEYQFKTEFQSHEPEFDYLKSVEIEERINRVRWCPTSNGSLFILSTNDKTIKLWKVKENKVKKVKQVGIQSAVCSENDLLAEKSFTSGVAKSANGYHVEWAEPMSDSPLYQEMQNKIAYAEESARTFCRKVYSHAHDFNINSISNNSDGETFISADELRINLWNLEISDQCFNIIDMKPSNMEDLTEVITSAEFHPIHCNLLAYSSSRGFIRIFDMRQSALCDHNARILKDSEYHDSKSFFTEIIASISDIKFTNDGQNILSRDYMNLKLWDIRMDSLPVAVFKIHERLRPKLSDLYNDDSIFDKFECCISGDGLEFATGSYRYAHSPQTALDDKVLTSLDNNSSVPVLISNLLRIFSNGVGNGEGTTLEASKNPSRKSLLHSAPRARRSSLSNLTRGFYRPGHDNSSSGRYEVSCNLSSKLLHVAWHPTTNLIACASGNSLLMYYA
ncbi:hypothetical protein Tsubulata_002946 [Turnera subulata]|uniref:Serine/threonine-protein phosphatase 2A 55 kDa regulatory subunit B n=1 Tax=Turnera subulata TaxID=218843 RepID=A0A9Q0JGV7_9ROSI|nr:hypothetical protein Tsubulata_002946 [Turnera subulata]